MALKLCPKIAGLWSFSPQNRAQAKKLRSRDQKKVPPQPRTREVRGSAHGPLVATEPLLQVSRLIGLGTNSRRWTPCKSSAGTTLAEALQTNNLQKTLRFTAQFGKVWGVCVWTMRARCMQPIALQLWTGWMACSRCCPADMQASFGRMPLRWEEDPSEDENTPHKTTPPNG
eukprot:4381914-Amphidinium_carterae.1